MVPEDGENSEEWAIREVKWKKCLQEETVKHVLLNKLTKKPTPPTTTNRPSNINITYNLTYQNNSDGVMWQMAYWTGWTHEMGDKIETIFKLA